MSERGGKLAATISVFAHSIKDPLGYNTSPGKVGFLKIYLY